MPKPWMIVANGSTFLLRAHADGAHSWTWDHSRALRFVSEAEALAYGGRHLAADSFAAEHRGW